MTGYKAFLNTFLSLIFLLSCFTLRAQHNSERAKPRPDTGSVIADVKAGNKLSIFKTAAAYTVSLKNTYERDEEGQLSYKIITESGEKLKAESIPVKLSALGSKSFNFDLPEMPAGFYKINFMINVSDYDDTIRRVFGISPQDIKPTSKRPADFDAFWQKAKDELAMVKPNFKMTEQPKLEKKGFKVFLVEMQSLGDITIRGWLTMPVRKGKFSTYLDLPGYQNAVEPLFADNDIAIFSLNVRGHGNSSDVIHTEREDYVTLHVEDKNRYVYRGAIMDCIRGIDFIYSRPELDANNLIVTSGSQGAFLAIATASLDHRVKLCSAQNPIFCDFRTLFSKAEWPAKSMKRYCLAVMHGNMAKLMDNLDYYDCKNFAVNVQCDFLMGMGLLDHLAPPDNVYEVYNLIASKNKKLFVYPTLTHEVGKNYQPFEYNWVKDRFGLYN
jgi:cephalosporin-C deacetylase-like acetyl esterase